MVGTAFSRRVISVVLPAGEAQIKFFLKEISRTELTSTTLAIPISEFFQGFFFLVKLENKQHWVLPVSVLFILLFHCVVSWDNRYSHAQKYSFLFHTGKKMNLKLFLVCQDILTQILKHIFLSSLLQQLGGEAFLIFFNPIAIYFWAHFLMPLKKIYIWQLCCDILLLLAFGWKEIRFKYNPQWNFSNGGVFIGVFTDSSHIQF